MTQPEGDSSLASREISDVFGLTGTQLEGKYEVIEAVAEGGFGVIYRGIHRTLEKTIAIKVLKIPADMTEATRGLFLQKFSLEARTIARLEHPGIVRVIDFGASKMPRGDAAPWMVLEWISGTTLEDEILSGAMATPMFPAEAFAVLRPGLAALAHAHDEGIAHRDIKPANMMLVRDRRNEVTMRVLDFGIAKIMGTEDRTASGRTATSTTLVAFSLHYAAPEQLSGTRTGPWTDVHAMALILTELLTGRAPYIGTDAHELYAEVLSPQRPTPRRYGVDVGAWEPVLARALSMRPSDRWGDAKAFLCALEAALPMTPARIQPPMPLGEPQKIALPTIVTTLRGAAVQTQLQVPSGTRRQIWPQVVAAGVFALSMGVAGWGAWTVRDARSPRPLTPRATLPTAVAPSVPVIPPVRTPAQAQVPGVASDAGPPLHNSSPERILPRSRGTPTLHAAPNGRRLPSANPLSARPPRFPEGARPTANEQLPAE